MRLKGIGEKSSEMLLESGIEDFESLSKQDPKVLQSKIAKRSQAKKIVKKLPAKSNVKKWIANANKARRMVHY